jgi:hypothetical protein
LRPGIAVGRSCASVLVIPRSKSDLVEALHGRRPWPDLSSMDDHGELTEGEEMGREKRRRGGLSWLLAVGTRGRIGDLVGEGGSVMLLVFFVGAFSMVLL